MCFPALIGALLWGLSLPWRRGQRRKKALQAGSLREVGLLLFFMFLSGLLWLTLTPPDLDYFLRTGTWLYGPFEGDINLVPVIESLRLFRFYWEHEMWGAILVNFPGNVMMFIPIGFFIGLLSDKPAWWKSTLLTGGCSLFIEVFQLFVSRGTDIDDLILNTFGGLCGYWVFCLLRYAAPRFTEKFQCTRLEVPHGREVGD